MVTKNRKGPWRRAVLMGALGNNKLYAFTVAGSDHHDEQSDDHESIDRLLGLAPARRPTVLSSDSGVAGRSGG
jgi:hypothetical protein